MNQVTIDGHTTKYGIIGNPVSHTLSPTMHTLAFQEIGINAVYLPFEITENKLPNLLQAFELLGVKGFNVTVPFKSKIIPFLDQISQEAKTLQSVNTVKTINGSWHGFSTDGAGLIRSLDEKNINLKRKDVLLLGAGGAAAAIAYSFMKAGVSSLHILNRTQSKADNIIKMLQPCFPDGNFSSERNLVDKKFEILINSTSVGMKEDVSPVDPDIVSMCNNVVDIIYSPLKTRLMKIADSLNIQNFNGLGMLLYQGVEAFEIWSGQKAPIKKMKETLFNAFV